MTAINGVLLDIDGVLAVSWQALPGAVDAVAALRRRGLPVRFLTNTTARTRQAIAAALGRAGFDIDAADILTAPAAAAAHLREHHPGARCYLLSSGDVAADLDGVTLVGEQEPADVVLIGGAGPEFSYRRLNHAFHLLLDGATLVAMHGNLLWKTASGLDLDAGAYIVGLKRAADCEAVVAGKPSPLFFRAALRALGVAADAALMVGDDINADVLGAQRAGIRAVLVRTGKFRQQDLERAPQPPHAVIDSVADLPGWIQRHG
jgi:HAD superfamily hydrolase (TIGR01458 family)